MARTTSTLADFRTYAEDILGLEYGEGNNDLEDETILIATKDYMKFYREIEVLAMPEKGRKTVEFSVDDDGLDLTLITDLYDSSQGFKVYKDKVERYNRLINVPKGNFRVGYYIEGTTLYLNNLDTAELVIEYQTKAQDIPLSTVNIGSIVPDMEDNCEHALTLFIANRYYLRGQENFAMAEDCVNDARNLTMEKFNLKRRNAYTT